MKQLGIRLGLGFITCLAAYAQGHTAMITCAQGGVNCRTEWTVQSLSYRYWKFVAVPHTAQENATNWRVVGKFHSSCVADRVKCRKGTSYNDIQAVVAEWSQCENWMNGDKAQLLYASGRVTDAVIDVQITQPGTYCLAFSNKMSLVTNKLVSGEISFVQ